MVVWGTSSKGPHDDARRGRRALTHDQVFVDVFYHLFPLSLEVLYNCCVVFGPLPAEFDLAQIGSCQSPGFGHPLQERHL